jgi:hypothetical protein
MFFLISQEYDLMLVEKGYLAELFVELFKLGSKLILVQRQN